MSKWLTRALALLLLGVTPALAQQSGTIQGEVTSAAGEGLAGVVVAATSDLLPQARQAVSGANGDFQLPLLPPGTYQVSFSLEGMATVKKSVQVALGQTATVDASLTIDAVSEEIVVVGTSSLVNTSSAELDTSVTQETIEALPVGQEYRDLVKLIPGVQYTEDSVRGPSAGGSGQDNTYLFDGVNVTLPLFGTLSAEPSSHDVDQIAVVKGGANAVDFNRAGGFLMNSISRSGTNAFRASLRYQAQPESLTADRDNAGTVFEEDKEWWIGSVGGPIFRDRLYFYASYFAPNSTRESRSNLYGEVPDFESDRDELFGKLTFAPTDSLLFHASYRTSERTDSGTSVSTAASAGSTSNGSEATLDIGIFEASWVIDERSYASFRFTDFENQTLGRPDNLFAFAPRLDGSVDLDIAGLDTQGFIVVPGSDGANAFQRGFIERYGYLDNGTRVGGGRVGGAAQIDDNDFYRQSCQASYDRIFGEKVTHAFHVGYQWTRDEEDLLRSSNGWGTVTIPGGTTFCPANSSCAGQKVFFQAGVLQQGITLPNGVQVPAIHSEYESQNLELNDTIRWDDFTFNVGLLVSNDELYGQGLKPNSSNVSGFEVARGHKYEMYELDFADTLQPRLGAVWAYNPSNTVFASYARYVPAASSLPRAASWARNAAGQVNAYFDQNGNFIGSSPEAASSGKFFADDLDPRTTDEYMLGTTRELGGGWSARAHARYRYSFNFWEDTENDSRLRYEPPPGIPRELYIRDLARVRGEIGGSNFVIAELDRSFTRYWEAGIETEWRGTRAFVSGSYVWSHYYGNMDQDGSAGTSLANDSNLFIGSSNIADGGGRQLWDGKYGDLRGDRRHKLKIYGYRTLPWRASVGAFAIYQSGQPWEEHNYRVYPVSILAGSTSDSNRYAEPAGSRTTAAHHQLDLNYTQNFPLGERFNLQARLDVFNVYDRQTGYDIQDNFNSADFGRPQSFYDPRRFQLSVRLEF
ncbi:MAG: TonB-dependent receptor [Thermoanaerobaculia bacterium]|nr:TonB-dependent receptor [Thermoanaerobaculia bacterium]